MIKSDFSNQKKLGNDAIFLWSYKIWSFVILVFTTILSPHLSAQSKQALRYEIDAKRAGITYTSKDALPRGREFKRIDSTYYVGWMLEGTYKFDHAADYLGYKMAAIQLEKALKLLETDFSLELKTRTSDIPTYIKILKYHRDWDYSSFALMQCYSNMEEPSMVWKLLQRCKKLNLQDELYGDTFNYLAWTVHRNRFYSSEKYTFLKNSIDENEKYANKLTDIAAAKIKQDAELNKVFFGTKYETEKMPSVWHYKSILYTYQLNIESGAYYYEKLRPTHYFPSNNYATFCAIQAKFRLAENYYKISIAENKNDKRLNESCYYLSILNEYKNENKKGIEELKDLIKSNGSTPGFGWYNLALARNLIYDGQTDIAKRYALRAEQFKEIHIGTTLGQSHYDFTNSLIKLIIKNREIENIKFLHKNWWYSFTDLQKISSLTIEKYGLQFLIINQFAQNPERDRVIYKLFSTESTVSFDEIWQLIDGFSTTYFLNRFKQEIKIEKRIAVKRYYELFVAKLLIKKGLYSEAKEHLNHILKEDGIDGDYEKLFLARVFEAMEQCNQNGKQESISQACLNLYSIYPQLIPFSGLKMKMHLNCNDYQTALQQSVIKTLKQTNIEWTHSGIGTPEVFINFKSNKGIPIIQYYVTFNGKNIVKSQSLSYNDPTKAGENLSLYIFNIGNDDMLAK